MDTTQINFKLGKGSTDSKPSDLTIADKKMTERERLQAQLKKTLTDFQAQKNMSKEQKNGQAAQGGQGGAKQQNRQIGFYNVGKS